MMKNEILDEVDLFKGVQEFLNWHDMRHYMRVACHACESHLASHPLPEKGSGWHDMRHDMRIACHTCESHFVSQMVPENHFSLA